MPEDEIPELPRTTRRAAAPELIAKGSVNPAVMRQRMEFMQNVPMMKELAPSQLKRMACKCTERVSPQQLVSPRHLVSPRYTSHIRRCL